MPGDAKRTKPITRLQNAAALDLDAARRLLAEPPNVLAANHLQQAAEKFNGGSFTFPTPLADGTPYAVTVLIQPTGQTCTVANGTGTIAGADVTDVAVTCAPG